jgi:hypothetical protein
MGGRQVKTMSGARRRRLDIALGLVHRPRLLFLEPSTGLDANRIAAAGTPAELERRIGGDLVTFEVACVARRCVPGPDRPVAARVRPAWLNGGPVSVLRNAMVVFGYQLRLLLRHPAWFFIGLVQPLLYRRCSGRSCAR